MTDFETQVKTAAEKAVLNFISELTERMVNHMAAELATDIKQILAVKERREMLRGLARDHMEAVMKAGPALEPVRKGNRSILKSSPFYNEDGECWCFESADGERDVPASWHLRVPYHADKYFLPHYHFPVPGNHSPDATKRAELEGQPCSP
jgi:hypothetical protein